MKPETLVSDLENAVQRLDAALKTPPDSDLLRAGCIQYFEFCFELAWKSIRLVALTQGLEPGDSPKKNLRCAFSNGWIDEEEVWLEMLMARNRMTHTYSATDALKVYDALDRFNAALKLLLSALKREVK